MLGSTTGCWANGCSGFGMLVQAGRRCKAKNSPLCRARQPESWAPSGFLQNQPAASPLAERNARIMQSNCARKKGWSEGERQPSTLCLLEPAQHVSAAWRAFSREKGRLSRALAHGSSVWATGSRLYKHCIVFQCLCPAPSQGLVGIPGRHRLDLKALPLPQSHPWTLPKWRRTQASKTSFPLPKSYLVPHPACPTTSQVPLQEENKCAGCSAPQWLEDTREAGCEQRTAWLQHGQGISMKKSWQQQQQQGRCKGRLPAFVSIWFPWCTVQRTHSLVLAQKQEKVLIWLRSGDPSSNSRTFPTSQPVLLPCNLTSLSHASASGALTCKTLFQRHREERAVTPDLKWDSKEGELALSPAFVFALVQKKIETILISPTYGKILIFWGGF